jgi:hypothetical protein
MKKGGQPLVPTARAPVQPILPSGGLPGAQAGIPTVGFGAIPVSMADLGLTPGPLGGRRTNPETRAKIAELYRRVQAEKATEPITLLGATAPQEPVQEQPVPVEPPTPRLAEPPSPMAFGQPTPPASAAPAEPTPATQPVMSPPGPKTPMQVVALSGAETRIKSMQLDVSYMEAVSWRASPQRREFFSKNRCRPIDWSAMFTSYDIRQDVLIWTKPDDIWVTLRTMTSDDEYLARRVIAEHYAKTDADYEVGSVVTTVAAGLVRVKDLVLPPVPPPGGNSDSQARLAAMKARVEIVLKLPYALTTDIAINYSWFVLRVQEEQRSGELGNG